MKKLFAGGFIISFLLVVSLFFTSCSHINTTSDSLGVPSANDDMKRIENAVIKWFGFDSILTYPLGGKNNNPVTFVDLNGDGTDEILMFHRDSADTSVNGGLVHIAVFSEVDSELRLLLDIQPGWYDISKFEISDLDGDGVSELIVGCQNLDTDKRLSVYSFSEDLKSYERLRQDQYTDWLITDINNDGLDDVVLIYNNNVQKTAFAIAYKPGCSEDENILDYMALGVGGDFYSMISSVDSKGNNYILVSSKHETMLSSVQILCWDPLNRTVSNVSYSLGKMNNSFSSAEDSGYNFGSDGVMSSVADYIGAMESAEVIQSPVENIFYNFCTYGRYVPSDVNNDGLIEFPMYYELNESTLQHTLSLGKEQIKYRYNWYRFETDIEKFDISDFYRSTYHRYLFKINDSWGFDRVYISEISNNYCDFYYIPEGSSSVTTVLLFRIRATQAEVSVNDNIIPLAISDGFNYYIEINPELPNEFRGLIPPERELKDAFLCEFKPDLINVFDGYISNYHNYIFVIDEFWNFKDIAVFENYNKDLVFYYIVEPDYLFTENSDMKIPLFTIKTSAEEISEGRYTVPLAKINNLYYYAEIDENVPLKYKKFIPVAQSLKNSFVPAMITAAE